MLNPFHRRQGGVRVGCWWLKGLGEDGKRGQLPWGCCLLFTEVNASSTESSALPEFLVAGQDQRSFCFCCLGKLSQAQENYLDKHSRPMLDKFWVCFAFLWGTECLGCASRLALRWLGAFALPPCPCSPWVCALLCSALRRPQPILC